MGKQKAKERLSRVVDSSSASSACPSHSSRGIPWRKEGGWGGGSDCVAPCVASFPLLMNSTETIGLCVLPRPLLQRYDNMQDCPVSQFGLLSERKCLSERKHCICKYILAKDKPSIFEKSSYFHKKSVNSHSWETGQLWPTRQGT